MKMEIITSFLGKYDKRSFLKRKDSDAGEAGLIHLLSTTFSSIFVYVNLI